VSHTQRHVNLANGFGFELNLVSDTGTGTLRKSDWRAYKINPPKWQKNDLVLGGHGRAAKLGACVNWVDWLRTSADKRMWSGRRAVVMV